MRKGNRLLGFIMILASVMQYAIYQYATSTSSNVVVCGDSDLRPCPPGVTTSGTYSLYTFTPPGCSMSGGIVSCTELSSQSASPSLGAASLSLAILILGILLGTYMVIRRGGIV